MPRDIEWDAPKFSIQELQEQGVERWQTLSVEDAAYFAQVSHVTLREWLKHGWMEQDVHWRYNVLTRTYTWDLYRLYELRDLGKAGRKRLKKTAGTSLKPDQKINRVVDLIREEGWKDDDIIDMTLAEAAKLVGISKASLVNLMNTNQVAYDVDYCDGQDTTYAFIMGSFVRSVEAWKATHPVKRKRRMFKEDEENMYTPKRRTKAEQLRAIKEFEGGYVPPSERQDFSDVEAIRLQERAEKGTARLMGNKSFRGRPSILKQRTKEPPAAIENT